VYIKLVVLLRNYVTMMHGQQNIKNGWATIVVVGRLRVNSTATFVAAGRWLDYGCAVYFMFSFLFQGHTAHVSWYRDIRVHVWEWINGRVNIVYRCLPTGVLRNIVWVSARIRGENKKLYKLQELSNATRISREVFSVSWHYWSSVRTLPVASAFCFRV
jgi:hypothetical protein